MIVCTKRYIWLFCIMSILCMMGCSKGTRRNRVTEDFFEQYPENWENVNNNEKTQKF